jgi:hypothetical protein
MAATAPRTSARGLARPGAELVLAARVVDVAAASVVVELV